MKNLIVLLFISLTSFSVFPQGIDAAYKLSVRHIEISQINEFEGLSDEIIKNMDGSPYANDNFILGNIYENGKLVKESILLIKNQTNTEKYTALLKNPDLTIKILNEVYVFIPFNGSLEKGNYFSIISTGNKFDLYKKTTITFKQSQKGKTSYENDTPAKFITNNTLYLVSKDTKFYELPKSKSKFYKVFKTKEKEMKSFAKKSKLKIKNEIDIKRLLQYYHSIL
jgi:hypothetical protein